MIGIGRVVISGNNQGTRSVMALTIGKIYRLEFPGIAARVIEPPKGMAPAAYPFLVESLFIRSRWYVNEHGISDYGHAPPLIVKSELSQLQIVLMWMLPVLGAYLPLAIWLSFLYAPDVSYRPQQPETVVQQLIQFD